MVKKYALFAVALLLSSLFIFIQFNNKDIESPEQEDIGLTRVIIEAGDAKRSYFIYEPDGIAGRQLPVVIVLHGGGGPLGTAELIAKRSGWIDIAYKEKLLVVFPQGTLEKPTEPVNLTDDFSDKTRNIRTWSDGSGRTNASMGKVDDVGFIRKIISDLRAKYQIDEEKIFATGFSNGATMTYYLGTQLSDVLAAIAPVAGLLYTNVPPDNPVSLLNIVGGNDSPPGDRTMMIVPRAYAADYIQYPVERWAGYLDCKERNDSNLENYTIYEWNNCIKGTGVKSIIIKGLGHSYPGHANLFDSDEEIGNALNATIEAWDFFKSHPKKI